MRTHSAVIFRFAAADAAGGPRFCRGEKARAAESLRSERFSGVNESDLESGVLAVAELVGAAVVGNYAAATSRPPLPEAAAAAASAPSSCSSLFYFSRRRYTIPPMRRDGIIRSRTRSRRASFRELKRTSLSGDQC